MHKKLLVLLHKACSEMRYFVGTVPNERVFDLADAVEFIPETMLNWDPEAEEVILATMRDYQKKYSGQGGYDYVALLTMEEQDFRKYHLREGHETDLNDPQAREFIYGPGANGAAGTSET